MVASVRLMGNPVVKDWLGHVAALMAYLGLTLSFTWPGDVTAAGKTLGTVLKCVMVTLVFMMLATIYCLSLGTMTRALSEPRTN